MHFAAQTHVDNSFGNSFQFTQNNIMGTHVLLESAKRANIKRFIHVSTDEVYGEQVCSAFIWARALLLVFIAVHMSVFISNLHLTPLLPLLAQLAEQDAMDEEDILEPTNPYAATKAGAEFLAKSYMRSFNLPVIITRGNNVYGPHQYPEKLVPKFINQLMRGNKVVQYNPKRDIIIHPYMRFAPCCRLRTNALLKQVTLHGTGENKRNFLYVEDVARAFELILFKVTTNHLFASAMHTNSSVMIHFKSLFSLL
jgi:dTDP-D-glucose 4,6-dehydratase